VGSVARQGCGPLRFLISAGESTGIAARVSDSPREARFAPTSGRRTEQMSSEQSRTTVLLAFLVNVAVMVTKLGAGLLAGSTAMISEGIHSISDIGNEVFLVTSVHRSERPADTRHPFGYGAERFFWSFVAAMGIFITGGMLSLFEAYTAFTRPPGKGHWTLEYGVLGVAALLEGASLVRAVHQIRSEAASANRRPWEHVIKSSDPSVKTVASEDLIAVAGLVVAALGIGLHQLTGNGMWEGASSSLIGLLLIAAAFALARDNMSLLIGESVPTDMSEVLQSTISEHPMVSDVVELMTRYLGADEVMVAARVELIGGLSSDQIAAMSSEIDAQLRSVVSEVTQVFIDATPAGENLADEHKAAS
jgi:cation diffusion facilitator family transporter